MKRTVARWASSKPPTASTSAKPSVQHATLTSARRRNYDLAILGGGLFLFVGAVLWEVKRRQKLAEATHAKLNVSSQSTSFTVKDGKSSSKTLDMLSSEQVNERLIRSAGSMTLARPGNPVQRVDSSSLPSNEPCEDDAVFTLLERDHSPEDTAKDLVFFGVFDGHSGWHTSRTLREKLISYVARELHAVYTGASMYQQLRLQNLAQTSPDSNQTPAKPAESFFRRLLSSGWLTKSASGDYILKDLDADDSILAAAIRNAFKSLDSDIVLSPIRLLERQGLFLSSTASSHTKGNVSEAQANAVQTLLPAMSGSCALLAFIDAARQKLHVASTGDSRAVMGTWDETAGKWRVDILTEDQTAKNSKEADRVRSEHPESEKDTVIARGRILGGLEPSRAFGDGRYKWPVGTYDKLTEAFAPGRQKPSRPNYLTPPYVTADPVVTTRDLSPTFSLNGPSSKAHTTRFLIMATDGLWDRLDNNTVVGLVGAALSGQTSNLSLSALQRRVVPDDKPPAPGHTAATPLTSNFVFQDTNLATHLVRNALGGADKQSTRALLSIPPPLSRKYRDDITVTVVLMGDPPSDLKITAEPLSAKI